MIEFEELETKEFHFINDLLDSYKYFKKEITIKERLNECINCCRAALKVYGYEYIKQVIRENGGYNEFLKTPYWKTLSAHIKYKSDYKCCLCGSKNNLNVHHNTYEHLGFEILHQKDLVCICKECHEKYHFE